MEELNGSHQADLILLVDDDATGRSVRALVLAANGHHVLEVGEAQAALSALASEPIRLVIVDYFLDGLTGDELARQMRLVKADVPILLLSGSEVPEDTRHVDDCLSKLEPLAVIEEKIAELLQRPGRPMARPPLHGGEARRGAESQKPMPRIERETGSA
ncbi:MAG: response regulator [Candidatus Korobacteraceae bacterium]